MIKHTEVHQFVFNQACSTIYLYTCNMFYGWWSNVMQILLLYDHWDNPQIIFDGCYQLMMSISFIGRQMNEFLNHDKVSFYNHNVLHLLFLFTYVHCDKTISDLIYNITVSMFVAISCDGCTKLLTNIGIYLRTKWRFKFWKIILCCREGLQNITQVSMLHCNKYVEYSVMCWQNKTI